MRVVEGISLDTIVIEAAECVYDGVLWNAQDIVQDITTRVRIGGDRRYCVMLRVQVSLFQNCVRAMATANTGRFIQHMRRQEWRCVSQHHPLVTEQGQALSSTAASMVAEVGFVSPTGVPLHIALPPCRFSGVEYSPSYYSRRPTFNYEYESILDRHRPVQVNFDAYAAEMKKQRAAAVESLPREIRETRDIDLGDADAYS